jgi:hypothetical protein
VAGPGRPGRQPGATSRAYEHAARVYEAMERLGSVPVAEAPPDVRELASEGVERVFVGNLLPFLVGIGYTSRAQYADIKTALVAMGCIRQLQRGARHKRGAWALLRAPDEGLWREYVGPFRSRELADQRAHHDRLVVRFFAQAPTTHRELLVTLVAAGVRSVPEVLAWLAALPERRFRALFPAGQLCVAEHVPGAVHCCAIPGLDPTVPDTSAGGWKRRADHLADLAEAD